MLVLLVFGFASIAAYWLHAAARTDPLFDAALFGIPTLRIGLLGNLFSRLGSGCMPFLIPLLLQVSLGYSPLQAGLMMLPIALAGMAMKRVATPLIMRYGYRRVLVVNTALVGLTMASFAPGDARRSRSRCTSLQLAGLRRGQLAAVHRDEHRSRLKRSGRRPWRAAATACCRWCRCWR